MDANNNVLPVAMLIFAAATIYFFYKILKKEEYNDLALLQYLAEDEDDNVVEAKPKSPYWKNRLEQYYLAHPEEKPS